MINTYHKNRMSGFSTLMMTLVILVCVTLLAFLSASTVLTHQKVVVDERVSQQAFNAAQAGLEHGMVYLDNNYSTLIDGETVTGSLPGGANYSTTFIFESGKNLIEVTSVGTSSDGLVNSNLLQRVKYQSGAGAGSMALNPPPQPLTVRGSVDLTGNTRIENSETGTNVVAGGVVTLGGSAQTYINSFPSSNRFITGMDINQGDAGAASSSDAELENTYLGRSIDDLKKLSDRTYTSSLTHDYSGYLTSAQGQTITIEQLAGKARIRGSNLTLGSAERPINIIVDGNLEVASADMINGNVTIHGNLIVTGNVELNSNVVVNGLVFVLGTTGLRMEGNALVNGGVISGGDATITQLVFSGNSKVKYDSAILKRTISGLPGGGGSYGRLAGTWKDFASD